MKDLFKAKFIAKCIYEGSEYKLMLHFVRISNDDFVEDNGKDPFIVEDVNLVFNELTNLIKNNNKDD